MIIGDKIKRYREENNLTQEELAKELNITQSHLSKLESGKKAAGRIILRRLIEATGYEEEYWTQRVLEITCSNCGKIARAEARRGNNHIKIKCTCGQKKELVIVTSTRIEMAYEVQEVRMNTETLSLDQVEDEDIINKRIAKLIDEGYSISKDLKKLSATTDLTYKDIKWRIKVLRKSGVIRSGSIRKGK